MGENDDLTTYRLDQHEAEINGLKEREAKNTQWRHYITGGIAVASAVIGYVLHGVFGK